MTRRRNLQAGRHKTGWWICRWTVVGSAPGRVPPHDNCCKLCAAIFKGLNYCVAVVRLGRWRRFVGDMSLKPATWFRTAQGNRHTYKEDWIVLLSCHGGTERDTDSRVVELVANSIYCRFCGSHHKTTTPATGDMERAGKEKKDWVVKWFGPICSLLRLRSFRQRSKEGGWYLDKKDWIMLITLLNNIASRSGADKSELWYWDASSLKLSFLINRPVPLVGHNEQLQYWVLVGT